MCKPLTSFIKKEIKKAEINGIRNEREVKTDTTEIQSILRKYDKLYAKK